MADGEPPRIAVVGVGLIGGSLGMAARERVRARVRGFDADPAALDAARERGAIDESAQDIADAVGGTDAVFVATPVGALAGTVRQVLAHAGERCVVSDVGSTKLPVTIAAADQRFVGGHPLAGAEGTGIAQARADMFEGATWYLTPAPETSGVLYERLHRLLVGLGARPVAIDAAAHDRLMACVSHLPHVLANVLVEQAVHAIGAQPSGARLGSPFAGGAPGPSFRDATRVAGANSDIWTDIYISNRAELCASIGRTIDALQAARKVIDAGDAAAVRAWNEAALAFKQRLARAEPSGEGEHELRVVVPNRPGVIAQIALALGRAGVNIADLALSPSADNSQGVVALWVQSDAQAREASRLVGELGFPVIST
jgi:prephenate dehydrogenase